MANIFIRPKELKDGSGKVVGFLRVRDLAGAIVPSYGAEVEPNSFWQRKLNDQDVEAIPEADFNKGKKAFEKAAEAEAKRLLAEQAKNETTPPAGA
jgi:hypothetical protein